MAETRSHGFPSKLFSDGTLRLFLFTAIVSGLVWLLGEVWALFAIISSDSSDFRFASLGFDKIQALGRVGYIFFQLSVWGIVVSTLLMIRQYILERNSIGE